jgi:hypothetical protein
MKTMIRNLFSDIFGDGYIEGLVRIVCITGLLCLEVLFIYGIITFIVAIR